jgi:vacuolar-type H+-ATPase subunit H
LIPSLRELIEEEKIAKQHIQDAREEAKKILSRAMEKAELMISEAKDSTEKAWEAKIPGALKERSKLIKERYDKEAARLEDLANKNHERVVDFLLKRVLEVRA